MNVCEISPSNPRKPASPVVLEDHPVTLGHLSFRTVGLVHSAMDDKAESRRSRALQSQGGQEDGLEEVIIEVKESQVVSG